MPLDKTKLGNRYTCFSCGTKFYDLNRPVPTCPECGADQNDAPVQDLKALLSRSRRAPVQEEEPEPEPKKEEPTTDDEGLFDDAETAGELDEEDE